MPLDPFGAQHADDLEGPAPGLHFIPDRIGTTEQLGHHGLAHHQYLGVGFHLGAVKNEPPAMV